MSSRLSKLPAIVFALMLPSTPPAGTSNSSTWQEPVQQLQLRADSPQPTSTAPAASLTAEVQRRMIMSPYYDVFGWLEGEVRPDGSTVLRGQVVRQTLRSDAESSVRHLRGITRLSNDTEVLPLSPGDDHLRVALYGAIYEAESPLFRYVMRTVPPVHIIVKGGRVALKGAVATKMESQQAYKLARGVPGVFEIMNQLIVEGEAVR